MTDKSVRRGAAIERRFDNRVDKEYSDARKKLLKDMEPFFRQLRSIEADAKRFFPDGDRRADDWKKMKIRDAVNAFKVKEKIEKALNAAWKSCAKDYANGLLEIGAESLMNELEGVLDEDI